MKVKYLEEGTQDFEEPEGVKRDKKRRLALLPMRAVDCKYNLGKYLVWLEWVTWNDAFQQWEIEK